LKWPVWAGKAAAKNAIATQAKEAAVRG